MAEKKETKKETPKKESKKALSLAEMKNDLQKLVIDVKTGKEKNTSKIKDLKKQIARELTKINNKEVK